jgi:hypothetical protein
MLDQIRKYCDEIRPMENRLHLWVGTRGRMEALLEFAFAHRLNLISVNPIRPSLEEHFQWAVRREQDSERSAAEGAG